MLTKNTGINVTLFGGILLLVAVPLVYAEHQYPDFVLWPKLLTAQIATLVLVARWMILAWQGRSTSGRFPLDLPALLFLLISGVSWFRAINPFSSGLEVIKLFAGFVLFLAVSRTFNRRNLIIWIHVLTCTAALISAIGICQYIRIGFLDIPSAGQPSSTLFYRNLAAMYLVMVIPLAVIPFVMAREAKWEFAWGLLFTLPVLFLIYTRTRGAWVGMAGALLITFLTVILAILTRPWPLFRDLRSSFRGRKILIGILILCVIVGGAQIHPEKTTTVASRRDPAPLEEKKAEVLETVKSIVKADQLKGHRHFAARLPLWEKTLKIASDHWMTGVGIGNWALVHLKYGQENFVLSSGALYMRPHNDFLWIASELGLPGLVVYFWLLVSVMFLILRMLQRQKDPWLGLTLFAIAVSIFAISGHAIFSFPRERIPPTMLIWFYLGIVSGTWGTLDPKTKPGTRVALKSVLIPGICFICLAASIYPVTRTYRAARAFYWALAFSNGKNWDAAQHAVERAVSLGVFDYRLLLLQAHAYAQDGKYEKALEASRGCLRYHPNSVEAYQRIGKLSILLNQLEAAKEAFLRALELEPLEGSLYRDIAVTYRRLGQIKEAHGAYERAVSRSPNDGQLMFNLAGFYHDRGWNEDALRRYRQAVRLLPRFAQAYIGLATSALLLGREEEALAAYESATEMEPNLPEPYLGLGMLYARQGRIAEAIEAYGKFLDLWEGESEVVENVRQKLSTLRAINQR